MPDFTDIYQFPSPLGTEPPDGPGQIKALAMKVEDTIKGVQDKVTLVESGSSQSISDLNTIIAKQGESIANLQLSLQGGVVTPGTVNDLTKAINYITPMVVTKKIVQWKDNPEPGDWKRWTVKDLRRIWQGAEYDFTLGGTGPLEVVLGWSARNDLLVEEYEAWIDDTTNKEFSFKVKCKKDYPSKPKETWIGDISIMVFNAQTGKANITDAQEGNT